MKRILTERRRKSLLARLIPALIVLPQILLFASPVQAADVNGDFTLELAVNRQDMLASQSFTVQPDDTLLFDLYIHDVNNTVEMSRLSVEIFLAGIPVGTITQELDRTLNPGESYRPELSTVNASDYL